jgi:hypothetical protein
VTAHILSRITQPNHGFDSISEACACEEFLTKLAKVRQNDFEDISFFCECSMILRHGFGLFGAVVFVVLLPCQALGNATTTMHHMLGIDDASKLQN